MKFRGAFSALRNSEYLKAFETKIKDILGSKKTISLSDLKSKGSVFSQLENVKNNNLAEIMGLDGDVNTLSENELMVLLTLLDGETKDKEWLYDGVLSLNENSKINNVCKGGIHGLYESIKNKREINDKSELNINGEIDFSYQVGNNCWFLSQLNGYAQTDFGKKIIKNSIEFNEKDGTYSVNFKGDNKIYKYTKKELLDAKASMKYAASKDSKNDTGLLLEVAFEDLFADLETEEFMSRYSDGERDIITDNDFKKNGDKYIMRFSFDRETVITEKELKEAGISNNPKDIIEYAFRKHTKQQGLHGADTLDSDGNFDVLKHLTGDEYNVPFGWNEDINQDIENIAVFLKLKAQNKQDFALFFNSSYEIEENKVEEFGFGTHVYYVNDVKLNENGEIEAVGINNPHDSSAVIYKSFKDFLKCSIENSPFDDAESYYQFWGSTQKEDIKEELEKRRTE